MTTAESARLLLRSQLEALHEVEWTVLSGDDFADPPAGIRTFRVPMRREFALSDPAAFVRLWRFLRRAPLDFVQTHTPKASFLVLPAARIAGKTAVYTMHGALYFRGNSWLRNVAGWAFERWCCLWANVVLLQSREDMTVVPTVRICHPRKLVYVGNGIDVKRFAEVPPPASGRARVRVTMISRLVAEKGCRDFFEVAKRLGAEAEFVHVGPIEDDQRDAITSREMSELEAAGIVHFAGKAADVRPHLAAADIVVLPSYREGIPRAAMEAAAAGRPVVAYDIRGVREVIPGSTGLLVPLGDVAALADVLRDLIGNETRRRALGEECRDRVVRTFSEEQVVERLRTVYRELAGSR